MTLRVVIAADQLHRCRLATETERGCSPGQGDGIIAASRSERDGRGKLALIGFECEVLSGELTATEGYQKHGADVDGFKHLA